MLSAWHIVKFKHCVALQYTNNVIRNAEMIFITIQNAERNQLVYMLQKYHKTTCVRCGGNYLHYTGPTSDGH